MKRIIGWAVTPLLALVLTPAESQATIPSCLKFKGTLVTTGESTMSGDVFKQKLLKVRFSEKDALVALGAPKGACIQVVPEDAPTPDGVFLVDADGNVLQNLSAVAQVNLETENMIFSGSYNGDTEAESSLILFRITIDLAIGEVEIEVDGVAFEKYKAGALGDGGLQKVKATIKAKVSGDGMVDGGMGPQFALVEGTAALSGSGEFD